MSEKIVSTDSNNKTVVLGVTGSIAAYKSADLCSKLVQNDINVVVIMTQSACKLITPLTFFTLSKNRVITDLWEVPEWKPAHIALAEIADLFVVAPCTANFIAKYTHGIADDALSTFAISYTKRVLLAPAMNPDMWDHPATHDNCEILRKRGVTFVGPAEGNVACGYSSRPGRMEEVPVILSKIKELLI